MRRIDVRLAIACICAVATALSTGAALAGNGKESAPGQLKKDASAQPSTQAAVQADASAQATAEPPGQAKQSEASSSTAPNGEVQQTGNASTAVAGMKPASSTNVQHWTTCTPTGGTSSSATCPSRVGSADAAGKSDASKRYGNVKTAAEIAVSRGGAGVTLKGPGNSQPHKVSLCGKPGNPSGGVDVHAVRNYASTGCRPVQSVQVTTRSVCGSTSVTAATTTSQAVVHGNGMHLGRGTAKHTVTSSSTTVSPTGEVCSSGPGRESNGGVSVQSVVTPAAVVAPAAAAAPAAPATGESPAAAGSVLGTKSSLSKSSAAASPKAQHGVLGTVAKVSGSTLPFTGFPLWAALLAALGLIGTGVALRRRGSAVDVR